MAIKVKNFTEGDTAISYENGQKCLEEELKMLRNENRVVLDFEGVSYVITAFLNPVIGDLILQEGADVMKCIDIVNANESILQKIKMVKDGALIKREDME